MQKATSTTGFSNASQGPQMFPVTEYLVSPSAEANLSGSGSHPSSLLLHLSDLKDKLNQLQNLVELVVSPEHGLPDESTNSMAVSNMNSTIQELIVAARSMRFTCQQMVLGSSSTTPGTNELHHQQFDHDNDRLPHQSNFGHNRGVLSNIGSDIRGQTFYSSTEAEALDWFAENYNHDNSNSNCNYNLKDGDQCVTINEANNSRGGLSQGDETDIIELDAMDLLARYTHFCQVCGKGFKRDANLRMHMRAHGDEFKTNAALKSNPMKKKGSLSLLGEGSGCLRSVKPNKYSCPHEGCRWNQKHPKFQPLKSMICVKNHYKRSHCPKMYVCKRCNQKQFSVLSDLRTHEKHCGDPKWLCSCGTTFSRKDKLMGHVGLFVGHTPIIGGSSSR